MKKRMMITGGAGMVGSQAAEYFAKKNWKVVVLDNLIRSHLFEAKHPSVEYNWRYLAQFRNIQRVKGDIRSERDVRKAAGKGVDVVLHTAGQPGVGFSIEDPREDFSINADGTLNVLETIRKISPKATFLFCSTNKVYGENVDKIPLSEGKMRYAFRGTKGVNEIFPIDLAGHTPYGVSKYTADLYVQEYGHLYGMRTGIFRMSCLAGGVEIATPEGHLSIKKAKTKPLRLYCYNSQKLSVQETGGSFETSGDGKRLYKVRTKRGYEILATGDHRFYTPGGYRMLDDIQYGSLVAVHPYSFHRRYTHFSNLPRWTILKETDVREKLKKYRRRPESNESYLRALFQKGLLPLSYQNPHIYTIASLVGYLTGDAHLYYRIKPNGKAYTEVQVYAFPEEIDRIKQAFAQLGFSAGKTRVSSNRSQLSTGHIIQGTSYKFSVTQTDAFAFFELLGVPIGHKSKIKFGIPPWIKNGPRDVQDAYLSGLFGAELSIPSFFKRRNGISLDLQPLIFSQSKNVNLRQNANSFRRQLIQLLKKRGVEVRLLESKFLYKKGGEKSICFQFIIKPSRQNFIRFSKIGYTYNDKRDKALLSIVEFLKTNLPYPHYEHWKEEQTHLLGNNGLFWDQLMYKERVPMRRLYDVTVPKHHNFIANGFLVHNCVYGTRQFGFEDQGWVAHFVIQAVLRRPITIYGDGKQVRDVLYVSDLLKAYERFIEKGKRGSVYNIGGGPHHTLSLLELVRLLEKRLRRHLRLRFEDWRPSDQKVYISDISKVKKDLGWDVSIPFEEGLEKLLGWVQAHPKLFT